MIIGFLIIKYLFNVFTAILKLVRFQNLLIIAVTQYLIRWCIISPFLQVNGFTPQLGELHFFFLVISTVLIAAGGYVINDYFDIRPDRVNKPDELVIDKSISRRWAILIHSILSLSGIGIGAYLSFYVSVPQLSLIFILASGLLWFYSTNYKKQFLIGNLIVSFLTAAVPMLVILFELPLLNREYGKIMLAAGANFNYIFAWTAAFAFFAFLTNLIREIIKDSEDFEGDHAYGMNTIPIVAGSTYTKIILGSLILFLISSIFFLSFNYIIFSSGKTDFLTFFYFLFLIHIPSLILLYVIVIAQGKREYHIASQIIKLIMISGILYTIIVRFMVLHQTL